MLKFVSLFVLIFQKTCVSIVLGDIMIRKEILEKLMPITDEERAIINGDGVDTSIYTSKDSNIISHKKFLTAGKFINVRAHTRFVHFPEHTHDYIEAVYMCSGQTTHIINGEKLVLSEGEIIFLGQNVTQEILPAREDDIAVNFIIHPSFMGKTLEMLGAEETPIKNFLLSCLFGKENQGYLHFKVEGILPIQNLIENLIWTLINNVPNRRNINQTTMGLLIMQLINHTDRLVYESREDKALMDIFRYIEENYKDGSLTDASEKLHYNFYWLSHEIKDRTGKTYTEHLQEKRMAQAAFLFKNTDLSVEEVALSVGYENRSYFHRLFTEKYGISPKKFSSKK